MHDGAIVFNTKIDNSDVEKDLKQTESKIRRAEESILKNENAKLPLVKQAEQLGATLDEAKRNLESIRNEMTAVQAAMAPGSDPSGYIDATVDYERVKASLDAQEKEVQDLQKEWDKVNDKVDAYDLKIKRSRDEIERSTAEAGRLRAKLGKGGNSLSGVFDKAEKSAHNFGKRILSIGMSAFVFNILSAGLRNAVSYMGKILQTNKQYRQDLARVKAALLAAFQPIYEFVLPGLLLVLKILTWILTAFGKFLAWLTGKDYGAMVNNAKDLYEEANAIESVGEAAKEAQKDLAGFDEINRLSKRQDISVDAGGIGKETVPDFDDLGTGLEDQLDRILERVLQIGAAFAAWKLTGGEFSLLGSLAFASLISDLDELWKYVKDFLENGPTFENVVGMISEFFGALGDVLVMAGKLEWGGAFKVLQGIGEMLIAINEMSEEGPNWDNVMLVVRGLSNFVIGLGALQGNLKLMGLGYFIQGVGEIIDILRENWEKIKEGDWSGVDKIDAIIAVVKTVGGLFLSFGIFSKIKGVAGSSKKIKDVATETGNVGGAMRSSLIPKLKEVAEALAWGVVIIAEVVAAAALIVGAIALLGWELEQVGKAWDPVAENGETILTAMGVGIALLASIGGVCYLLGTVGKTAALNIAIGMAVLAEIGIAAALFVAEIWLIGEGLARVADAWAPVLDNGDSVKTAILTGTVLLVAVGVAAAALGLATVASGGTIPAAIAIGTAMLVALGISFEGFVESIASVADCITNRLNPAMSRANNVLPELSTNMGNFVDYMEEFAEQVVRYTGATSIAGLASLVDMVVGWFAGDPIGRLSNEAEFIGIQASNLTQKLIVVNPEIQMAIDMVSDFHALVGRLNELLGVDITLSDGMYVNMTEVGMNLISGLAQGMIANQPVLLASLQATATSIQTGFIQQLQTMFTEFLTWQNTQFTMNGNLIALTYTTAASGVSAIFVAALMGQFATFFAYQRNQYGELRALILSTYKYGYTAGVMAGFITPTRANTASMVAYIRSLFTQLKSHIISSFNQAAAGARNAFSGLPSWFRSSVYNPIVSMLSSLNAQISSVISRASSARSYSSGFGGFFAKGGTLSSGWGIVGEAGPEIIRMVNGRAIITPLDIPYLATGAVLPANKPFMAMVGDQRHGTNIEAPLSVIQEAVAEVMGDQVSAMLAGFEAVVQAIQEKNMTVVVGDKDIGEANARYSSRMAIRRGNA